ncbi:CBS domain-containing protein [Spongiactinospora sp. TRM90649]|uniref:CBS domain-containing protein n=1 Tax=Spongiactinospora sp. TRM90649 TaxID=3031114 RepID=UPI0023F7607D|nr:CBS domain-containing protein [Spongiactinospora sp. TRM90649]MDF5754406.1 CBS domain-containing protein [Spongiactinospora sp. TRM90649]
MPIKVSDVMGRVAIAVRQDAAFATIVDTMRRFAVDTVAVVDVDRRPIGVVSQDDLALKESPEPRAGRRERSTAEAAIAADLMTTPAITVTPDTPAGDAARAMHRHRVRQLPVIDPVTGRIVGTLHRRDLLRVSGRPEDELRAEIDAVVRNVAGADAMTVTAELDGGTVHMTGCVADRAREVRLRRAVARVEGVVAVESDLSYGQEVESDLSYGQEDVVVPPLH